ncbi:MAG: ABC transporter permease [Kiritimatiellia bacterium]|jgi:iron(III) transport system permease protein
MLRNRTAWMLMIILTALLGVLMIWPLVEVIGGGCYENGAFTLKYIRGVFQNPVYAEGLLNSLGIAAGTTLLATLVAVPLAWLGHRYNYPGKGIFSALILVPLILPPFVGAIGILQMLGPYGALNALLGLGPIDWLGRSRYLGVVLIQALALYPILYLNVSAALANIDPAMEEAAANLGCRGAGIFRRVTLPLIMPGLFAGGTLVFIASFTELGTPLMLNYTRCAAVQIYDEIKEISASPFPYALVTVVLIFSVLLYLGMRLLLGRRAYAMQGKATVASQVRDVRGWRGLLVLLPFVVVTLLALTPHLGVMLTSISVPGSWYRTVLPTAFTGQHFVDAVGHDMTLNAIRNSLFFSSLAVMLNVILGLGVAWVVVRSTLRVRHLLDALAMIPLAVPGLVMAFGYLSAGNWLGNREWVRASPALMNLLDVRVNPTLFLVVAYAVRRLPYMVRAAVAGLQQTSVTLEEAAANLGARPARVLRQVTIPLIAANLIAGVLLVFSFSMLEVSDSLILAQKIEYYPITKTIFELFQLIGVGRHLASALGLWAMGFLTVTIVGSSLMLGKKLGALFRA